jgi:RNA polymerase sigma-70 factor (family 1)
MPVEINIVELQRRMAVYEDESAYKTIFLHYFDSLTRFSVAIVQSKEIAEEVVSDVFIQLWKDRQKADAIEHLQAYLFMAVKHNSVRKLQQQKNRRLLSLDELSVETAALELNPEEQLVSNEVAGELRAAIEALPNKARLIFKLAREDRMRYKEIAALLQISVKTIDNQLAIAVKKIAQTIRQSVRKKNQHKF